MITLTCACGASLSYEPKNSADRAYGATEVAASAWKREHAEHAGKEVVDLDVCRKCREPIDRMKLGLELAGRDILSVVERAVASSVYCSWGCAVLDLLEGGAR